MNEDVWQLVLGGALALNAVLGFAYRVYRLTKGGPVSDVLGQAVLGLLLGVLALGAMLDAGFVQWPALIYGLLFGLIVMPIWVLAVLIPQRPEKIDYAFTAIYWFDLVVIVIAALMT
jgi:uncharacterized membrane protein